ncbi:hypothetical protein AB0F07_37370 [Streptomyces fructofermentans]|uniref:hypothetical protein n=1 Tax=Streptomyces fructofermentans TaxID=152141 RepID=UPI0033ECD333
MGSMRNPVGPLPSSIYWRRRAVLLSMVALMALLITWVITSGGGGGGRNGSDGSNDKNPTASITPGPSGSESAISEAPGGRDESSDGGGGDDGASGDSGDSSGSGDSAGSAGSGSGGSGSDGGAGGGSGGAGAGGSGAGSYTGDTLPAGSKVPNCTSGAVKLTLRSVENSYAPDEDPSLVLTAKNSSGSDCKLDLGPKHTVLTITQAGSDDEIWSSDHCPKRATGFVFRVPANDQVTRTVGWDREPSAAKCATPPPGPAAAGTYLVEARTPGLPKAQTSFVLKTD